MRACHELGGQDSELDESFCFPGAIFAKNLNFERDETRS
jgi:hypothetical protein